MVQDNFTASDEALQSLDQLLKARHSCRGFRKSPVPREMVERIVAVAQGVPSWCNSQPWQLVIAEEETTKRFREGLMKATTTEPIRPDFDFPARYTGPYKERRSVTGWQLYDAVGVKRGDREGSGRQMMENFRLFGAPHVAIVTTEADLGVYGVLDCGAFVSAFMLAARAQGIASIAQAAVAGQAGYVREFFGLPDNRRIVCAISFGYEDKDHPANSFRTDREVPAEVIDWA